MENKATYKAVFTIGSESYEVSTAWHSVTFNKYLQWLNDWVFLFPTQADEITGEHPLFTDIEYQLKMLSFQTDIPLDILKQANIAGIQMISATQEFWFDAESLSYINNVDNQIVEGVKIGEAAAEHMISFITNVNQLEGKSYLNVMPDAIKRYLGMDIGDRNMSEPIGTGTVYGLATFFLFSLASFGIKSRNFYNLNQATLTKLKQVLTASKALA